LKSCCIDEASVEVVAPRGDAFGTACSRSIGDRRLGEGWSGGRRKCAAMAYAGWGRRVAWGTKVMITILIVILIVLLIATLPTWPYSSGWGYYPGGLLGLVLVIILILAVLGRI
jgi:hypothetical protein